MTTLEKTFDLNIGARVHCKDGQCGKLAKVVIDPDTLQVTNLIVEEGFLLKQARSFPVDAIEYSGDDDIYLSLHSADLKNYPLYVETEYKRPKPDWVAPPRITIQSHDMLFPTYSPVNDSDISMVKEKVRQGISSELEVVEKGTEVKNADGVIGKLDNVVSDKASGAVTHLIVHRGFIFTEQIRIPVSLIERVSEDGIFVTATNEELAQFSQSATIEKGDLNMKKKTNSESILTGETELASAITEALMADPRTSDSIIEVINERGVITLTGQVDSQKSRAAAEEIAANHPQVVSVVNSLKVTS